MMRYKPMLAHPVGGFERITEDDWREGLYSQPKLDGVRCLIQYDKDTWISIFETKPFEDQDGRCIFVGKPNKLIAKFKRITYDEKGD